jgi:putative transcriptional regulator
MDSLHNNHPDMQETMQSVKETTELRQWFVMRDLKRGNAKQPAYKLLGELKIRFFTPMVWKLRIRQGKRVRQQVPFMPDLLFVYDSRKVLDPLVEQIATLQYRFVKGGNHQPMTVRNADMERFIRAVDAMNNPCFYTPEEINPDMLGKKVRIVGGLLDGYEGCLQKMQGSRIKRLFVELPNLLTATVEVQPEFIQVLKS